MGLDTNIKLYHGKKKFGAELSHFSDKERHCPYCLNTLGRRVDQTFLHGSLECSQVSKLYRGMAQIFGFHETLPLNPKDIFIWKFVFKEVLITKKGTMAGKPFSISLICRQLFT